MNLETWFLTFFLIVSLLSNSLYNLHFFNPRIISILMITKQRLKDTSVFFCSSSQVRKSIIILYVISLLGEEKCKIPKEGARRFFNSHKNLSKASYLTSLAYISSICTPHKDDLSYLALETPLNLKFFIKILKFL